MPNSLFPSDEQLPTWLHTVLLVLVVSPFAVFLLWCGLGAVISGHLEPLSGPEPGQFFFGALSLQGSAARVAGLSLLTLGGAFLAIAFRFSRWSGDTTASRIMPWLLLGVSVALSLWVKSFA
jgi:hypothetical protein